MRKPTPPKGEVAKIYTQTRPWVLQRSLLLGINQLPNRCVLRDRWRVFSDGRQRLGMRQLSLGRRRIVDSVRRCLTLIYNSTLDICNLLRITPVGPFGPVGVWINLTYSFHLFSAHHQQTYLESLHWAVWSYPLSGQELHNILHRPFFSHHFCFATQLICSIHSADANLKFDVFTVKVWSLLITFAAAPLYYIIYLFLYLLFLLSHPHRIPIHHQISTPNMADNMADPRLKPWAFWITAAKSNLLEVLSLSSRLDRPRFGKAFIIEQHLECSQLPLSSDNLAIAFLVSVFKARTETGLTSCLWTPS